MKSKLIQAAAIAAVTIVLSGCAALMEGNTDAKLLTQYSVLKVSEGDPAKADRIEEIATEIKRYVGGEELLTVDMLIVAIRSQVDWSKLDAADTLLVNALLERLRTELTEHLGPDRLPEDVRLAADTVAGWVIEAARLI